jgi:hypothetical protein
MPFYVAMFTDKSHWKTTNMEKQCWLFISCVKNEKSQINYKIGEQSFSHFKMGKFLSVRDDLHSYLWWKKNGYCNKISSA